MKKQLLFAVAPFLSLFLCAGSALAQASVTTDKSDYPPGATVQISGSGFQAGETVRLQVLHIPDDGDNNTSPAHQPWEVAADVDGNFQATWDVPSDQDERGATLQLTATGLTSALTARATFTDSAITSTATGGNWNAASTWAHVSRTGTITTSSSATAVTGSGTSFTTQLANGSIITKTDGTVIGTVSSITDNTHLTLNANAISSNSGISYHAQVVPFSGDDATIVGSASVTVTANATVNSVTFDNSSSSATLTVNNNVTLTVSGALALQDNASGNNTSATITGSGTVTCASLTVGGQNTGLGNNGNITTILTSTISTLSISGNLAITGLDEGGSSKFDAATFALKAGSVSVGGTVVLTAGGSRSGGGANLDMSGSPATGTLTLSGGTPFSTVNSAVTFTASGSGATVNYSATANQTVFATTYNDVIFSGSGAKSMGSSGITVNDNLSVAPTGSATASVGAGLTLNVGTLTLGGTNRGSGTWGSTTSTATHTNNTYFAATTGKLSVAGGPPSVANSTATTFPTTGVLNDGTALSTVTVTALDEFNNPVTNATVTVTSSGTGNTVSSATNTSASGVTSATIKSTVAEVKTLTVTVNGTQITAQPTVAFGTAPSFTSQPSAQTACAGSTATFTPVYSGTAPLSYAWRKRSNGGWGNSWTITGGSFLGSSTGNENGGGTCNSFTSSLDINSSSGNAWGMFGGGTAASAIRGFTALTAGQVFRIDMDNGGVDSGKTNGFRLQQTSGPVDIFKFFFPGGQSNYQYIDSTGAHDTGIAFIRTGLRIEFHLVTSTNYTLLVTACGGSTKEFSGTVTSGSINRVLLENNNTSTGGANDLFFNNIVAGTFDDNAGNYTSSLATGNDKGDQLVSSSATNSSYTTATLATTDTGSNYAVIVYSPFGVTISANALLTVNARPTAVASGTTAICSNSSANISAALTGTGPWNVAWSDGQTQNSVAASPATRSVSPTVTTTYTVTNLTDANCTAQAGDLTGSAVITVRTNPVITTTSLGGGTANTAYSSQTVAATNGTTPYTFAVASGLPPGLSISSGGVISGTPTSAGTYTFTVTVTDANSCQGSKSLGITIACPAITISPATLPNLVSNASYSTTFTASGSSGFTFSQTGTLPPGMSFNTGTGVFSGTPTNTGNYTFAIIATDNSPAACAASNSFTVTVGQGAVITTQPTAQTTNSGQTATFSTTAAGNATLSYAWRRRSNAGWSSSWTVTGTQSFRSSTDNNNSTASCTSFSSNNDINSGNGNAWGLDGTATAIRGFTALTSGQVFRIDMDNGNVDSGKTNGFRVQQTSGATTLFWFYFKGGDGNYTYWDATGFHDTGVAFTYTGVRVEFHLLTSTTYMLLVTKCGSAPKEFSGTISAGNINRVLLENNNTSTGVNNMLFFNNLIAGTADDNASNYSSALTTGADKGDLAIGGATSASYTTPALTTADSGAKYGVLVYNAYGETMSSDATLTVNKVTPAFSNVTASQTITYGASSISVTGTVSAVGPVYPANGETITVTINGTPHTGTVTNTTGIFFVSYSSATVPASATPYTITYSYAGDTELNAAANDTSTTLTVNKATLTVAPSARSVTYNGSALNNTNYSTNTANYSITAFQNSETVSSAGVTLSGSLAFNGSVTTSVKNVGTYTQAVGTLSLAASNYVMTFSNPTPNNYVITARALTVTAGSNTKVYDGTTSATNVPSITSGSLQGSDTANFIVTYDTKNVGTGKTLTPSGTVTDGNSGNNYSYAFVTSANGIITIATSANAVTSSANPSPTGSNVTFTATLTAVSPGAGTPTGTVQFRTNGVAAGSPASLSGGLATFSTSTLPHGTNTVTAEYAGDGNFLGSTNSLSPSEVINAVPVANLAPYSRSANLSLKIRITDLITNFTSDTDGDVRRLIGLGSSTNGATITTNATFIFYLPSGSNANSNTTDHFNYIVSDGFWGGIITNKVRVSINDTNVGSPSANILSIATVGTNKQITFAGVPAYTYHLQRTETLNGTNTSWTNLGAATVDSAGTGVFTDTNPPPSSAYYRTIWP